MSDTLTAYGVHKLANARLQAENLKTIPPQMVYSYVTNKMIPHVVVDGQQRVRVEDAEAWVNKYVENRKRRAAEAAQASSPDEAQGVTLDELVSDDADLPTEIA